MESRAKFAGHAIHPMLIVFPLGLLSTSVIFDVINLATQRPKFSEAAYYMIPAGVVSGLVAGVFGLIDWTAIPKGTRAKRIGLLHAIGNAAVLGLFAGSWLLRQKDPSHPTKGALILALGGTGLAMVTGWLGGELVEQLGISINPSANVNAPSSLKKPHPRRP